MMAGRRPRANLIFSGHVSMSLFRRMARMPLLHDRHRRNPSASPWTYTFENAPPRQLLGSTKHARNTQQGVYL